MTVISRILKYEFQNRFIDDTIEFYQRAAQSFLAENSAEAYVNKANQCFIEELDRSERYLDPITAQKFIEVIFVSILLLCLILMPLNLGAKI